MKTMLKMKISCGIVFCFLGIFLLLLATPTQATAATSIYINGDRINADAAVYQNSTGYTMVPLRFVSEALGYDCDWSSAQNQACISQSGFALRVLPGKRSVLANSTWAVMPTASQMKNDRLMVPLRFIAETFGCTVDWQSGSKRIDIARVSGPHVIDQLRLDGRTVVLDPGHGYTWPTSGLYDPGAVGANGLTEQSVNLAVAKRAADLLKARGATVILTRTTGDNGKSLSKRAAMADSADIFVAIHCNSNEESAVSGTATYYHSGSSRLKADRHLASLIQDGAAAMGRRDIGVVSGWFNVLKYCRVPACILEIAFISNPTEANLMGQSAFIEKAAIGLANGILAYFN